MKDQESSICSISIHASGRHALTTANEIAQIWDLDTFTKKKTLNGAQTVGIQQVQFSCFPKRRLAFENVILTPVLTHVVTLTYQIYFNIITALTINTVVKFSHFSKRENRSEEGLLSET